MATLETSPVTEFAEAVPYRLKESPYGSHMLLLDALPAKGAGRKVLDLGCCNGYFAALMAERGYDVTGVERAGGHGPDFPIEVRLIEHDLEQGLPPIDSRFSLVICADILEHLRYPLALLQQARELMEPDGQLAASLPNSGNFYFRLNVLAGRFPKEEKGLFDRTHVQFFPWSGWVELFEAAGFHIKEVRSSAVPFSVAMPSAPAWLVEALEWSFFQAARVWKTLFAYQFIVVSVPRGRS
jgi:SAM-dependent methyltransferase